jgi:hypothetical protein
VTGATASQPPGSSAARPRGALLELAAVFLKLGATAFGGPAAHIAMMEQEVVRRRAWLNREEFLDLLGATNLIPGPNSTELAIHVGQRRAGWRGCLRGPAGGSVAVTSTTMWPPRRQTSMRMLSGPDERKGGGMKRRIATYAVAGLVLAGPGWAQRSATARETKADDLKAKLDKAEKVLVIDVRSDEEIKGGSIPGAIHIPMEQLEARMKDIPKDVQLVFT